MSRTATSALAALAVVGLAAAGFGGARAVAEDDGPTTAAPEASTRPEVTDAEPGFDTLTLATLIGQGLGEVPISASLPVPEDDDAPLPGTTTLAVPSATVADAVDPSALVEVVDAPSLDLAAPPTDPTEPSGPAAASSTTSATTSTSTTTPEALAGIDPADLARLADLGERAGFAAERAGFVDACTVDPSAPTCGLGVPGTIVGLGGGAAVALRIHAVTWVTPGGPGDASCPATDGWRLAVWTTRPVTGTLRVRFRTGAAETISIPLRTAEADARAFAAAAADGVGTPLVAACGAIARSKVEGNRQAPPACDWLGCRAIATATAEVRDDTGAPATRTRELAWTLANGPSGGPVTVTPTDAPSIVQFHLPLDAAEGFGGILPTRAQVALLPPATPCAAWDRTTNSPPAVVVAEGEHPLVPVPSDRGAFAWYHACTTWFAPSGEVTRAEQHVLVPPRNPWLTLSLDHRAMPPGTFAAVFDTDCSLHQDSPPAPDTTLLCKRPAAVVNRTGAAVILATSETRPDLGDVTVVPLRPGGCLTAPPAGCGPSFEDHTLPMPDGAGGPTPVLLRVTTTFPQLEGETLDFATTSDDAWHLDPVPAEPLPVTDVVPPRPARPVVAPRGATAAPADGPEGQSTIVATVLADRPLATATATIRPAGGHVQCPPATVVAAESGQPVAVVRFTGLCPGTAYDVSWELVDDAGGRTTTSPAAAEGGFAGLRTSTAIGRTITPITIGDVLAAPPGRFARILAISSASDVGPLFTFQDRALSDRFPLQGTLTCLAEVPFAEASAPFPPVATMDFHLAVTVGLYTSARGTSTDVCQFDRIVNLSIDVPDTIQIDPSGYVGLSTGGVAGGVVEIDDVRVFLGVATGDLLAPLVGLTPGS